MIPIALSAQAEADLEEAFAWYLRAGDFALATRFRDAVNTALEHICKHPGTGSPRHAALTGIHGLRFWLLHSFPYAVFHVEHPDVMDVLRVLHQASDLPRHLF